MLLLLVILLLPPPAAWRISPDPDRGRPPGPAHGPGDAGGTIDRLDPEHKRLLQAAAVIGTDVPFVLLQAVADEPEDQLRFTSKDQPAMSRSLGTFFRRFASSRRSAVQNSQSNSSASAR